VTASRGLVPARAALMPISLMPAGLMRAGLMPAGLASSGFRPAGLASSWVMPAGVMLIALMLTWPAVSGSGSRWPT
jgi:hypothetical protein